MCDCVFIFACVRVCVSLLTVLYLLYVAAVELKLWASLWAVPDCWDWSGILLQRAKILQTLTTLPSASQHAPFPWTPAIHSPKRPEGWSSVILRQPKPCVHCWLSRAYIHMNEQNRLCMEKLTLNCKSPESLEQYRVGFALKKVPFSINPDKQMDI